MKYEPLDPNIREVLDAARAAEPSLDATTRSRMRESLLGAVATAAITTAVGTASASTGAASGTSVAAGAGATTSIAPGAGAAALAAKGVGFGVLAKAAIVIVAGGIGVTAFVSSQSAKPAPPAPSVVVAPAESPNAKTVEPIDEPRAPEVAAPEAPNLVDPPKPIALAVPSTPPTAATAIAAEPIAETPPPAKNGFGTELATVNRARAALAAGDPNKALTVLDEPSSGTAFAEERQALHIVALCAAGRRADGARELDQFRSRFPRSLHTERASKSCETKPEGK